MWTGTIKRLDLTSFSVSMWERWKHGVEIARWGGSGRKYLPWSWNICLWEMRLEQLEKENKGANQRRSEQTLFSAQEPYRHCWLSVHSRVRGALNTVESAHEVEIWILDRIVLMWEWWYPSQKIKEISHIKLELIYSYIIFF